ncbi:type II toxin-antitoxin system Phd/YefM family antitoxin [Rhodococcus sp. NPDC058521]|uniref:type II toxin-antitoxin system Phd/YefM family antitoxin n=1 Tax=Rhodococcus sp. NPDC058521 TaxID=3346536 RepID=UPI003665C55D
MKVIGIRELRQHASKYLARVEAGEELAVTNRGRTVARLVPVSQGENEREALIESGVLLPARNRSGLRTIDVDCLPHRNLSPLLDDVRSER